MATYLSVPLKKTWEVDLINPLRTFITNTYTDCNPDDYKSALVEFNKLRNNTIAKSVDKHESALEVLYRYYDQLVAIDGKFPISENQIRISFKWQDAFDKESFFAGKRTLTIAASLYERICVLFNIAALASQIADTQNLTSDVGLKLAAKLFQQSSGIFAHVQTVALSSVQGDPTPDLHPDSLNALSALMLAQGQDCFVRKAMNDKMKPAITAKLAMQCSDLYADAMKLLQLESIRGLWPKDWLNSVAGKQAAFHGCAQYHQSLVVKETKDFGEEIARLRHSKVLLSTAESRGGPTFVFHDLQKTVVRALQEAEKDNDFIYHAKIPELTSISSVAKAPLAKCTPLTNPLCAQFKDLFEKVVPLVIHQALTAFDNRKAQIINMEIGRLREATQLLNGVLASFNLPAAIEDVSGGGQVPQSVLEKAAKVRQLGGYEQISKLINDLPLSLDRNKEILDESENLLNEEEKSDRQLRDQFKERWTRTPSEKLTESIRSEASKYRTIISNAVNADAVVRSRFGSQKEGMEMLSKSDADIEKSLPSASSVAALQGNPVVGELRKLLCEVDGIKSRRDALERELKDANTDDMTSKFLSALSQDGALDEESLSFGQLNAIYSPLREEVARSVGGQESLLEQIQSVNNKFVEAKEQNKSGEKREEKLKSLASAYDSFVELKENLEEGTKFYNDLTQILIRFQTKVSDFCFARKTEKEELMKDLSASIARQSAAAPPSVPKYQKPPAPSPSQAPPQRQPIPQVAAAGQQMPPYPPTTYSNMPYPSYMPMPVGYNPYMNWMPQQPPYPGYGYPPPQQYPGQPQYPGYPPR